ncbi:AAA-like domain-containing protein [Desulfacinum hydrothermale DSM 13146]|uniref:AAA-like domain-containing protein n=1 Tax=Desulfacinum hydrothermale DSM 13146 TaxID=1121390 RepID=A0A1W1XYF7_9BACT|nr:TraM recognition domain-containing protein [Desulfacinum hydrothermale]SMC28591.1 AAA-like domain-containing protein [Desulfacinum hydrothermale DSM 13146]
MLAKLIQMLGLNRKQNDRLCIGDAIALEDIYQVLPRIHAVSLGYADRLRHWITFGTTGCGKTRLVEYLVEQDIRAMRNVCVIDPKGDMDLIAKIISTAKETGRENEVCFLSPVYPEISMRINPFSHYYRPEEIVQHVVASLPVSKDEFFIEVAKEITLIAVFSLHYLNAKIRSGKSITIDQLREQVTREKLEALNKELEYHLGDPEVDHIHSALKQVIASPADYFSKITSTLRTTLSQLSVGSIGQVIGTTEENEFIRKLEAGERIIMVIHTGSLMFRAPALSLARIFLSMVQALVGRLYASQRAFDPPLMVYIDEASNVFYPGIEDLFNKSRGAGVAIHALTQSLSDLETFLGEARTRVIIDNCNTRMFFKVNDPATSKYVCDLAGHRAIYSPIFTPEGDMRYTSKEETVLDEASALRLRPRQFILFTQHRAYRGRTRDVRPCTLELNFKEIMETNTVQSPAAAVDVPSGM